MTVDEQRTLKGIGKKNLTGKVSVRNNGVTQRIKDFFWKHPESNAKACCEFLKIDYDKYKRMCYSWKSKTKAILAGKVQGRVLKVPSHRVEWRTEKPLGVGYVQSLLIEALRRQPGKKDPKPFDEWYMIPNRNRQLQFTNDFVSIRVFIRSGTCRIIPRAPMDFESLKIHIQNAFFKAGLDLRKCEDLSGKIEPHDRHRMFRIGPVTPFKIDYYKDSLGLTLLADGSHPLHIEGIEHWPSWVKPLITVQNANTKTMRAVAESTLALAKEIHTHLAVMRGIDKSVQKLDVTIDKLAKAVEKISRKRKRKKRKPKPKPKSLFKRFQEKLKMKR